jgi:hypothetical protein
MSFRKDIILSADAACDFDLPALAQVLNPIWIRVLTAQFKLQHSSALELLTTSIRRCHGFLL